MFTAATRLRATSAAAALAVALLSTAAAAQTTGSPTGAPPVQDQAGEQHAQPATAPADPSAESASGQLAGAPTRGDDVVVTGSRIKRAGFDTVQPAVVLGSAQIEKLGYTNLADALSELPQFGVPGNSPVGGQSGFGAGQNFLDFFGLGSQRTLTLVNGRRFVSSNTASIFGPTNPGSQVDLNAIPEPLVDRVETIAIGGAPIYGSDAIAGTVNIILKRNFDGLRIEATNGVSQRGDQPDHRISAIAGKTFADHRGSIVVSGEYSQTDGLTTADRFLTSGSGPFFATAADPNAPYKQQLYYAHRYTFGTEYGLPLQAGGFIPNAAGAIKNAAGQVLTFSPDGRLIPLDFGTRTGSSIQSAGGNGFDIDNFGNLRTTSERYLGTALASFQITPSLRFFGEAWYSHSTATNLLSQPYYSTGLFGDAGTVNGNLVLKLSNPFLNPADRATLAAALPAGATTFELSRANTDLQGGVASSALDLYRFVGGLDGDFKVLGKDWHYEASVNYGRSINNSTAPSLVFQNLLNALNATTNAAGQIICAPGYANAPIATGSATCSPLNVFGQSNTATQQAAINYVTAIARSRSVNSQLVANINAQAGLFRVPGGDVQVSVGYEHRREATSFDPGAFYFGQVLSDGTRQGFGNSIPIDPIAGSFHTDEGFGEVNIPLVSPDTGFRFLNKLEIEASARYVQNSIAGGNWTYTYGGQIAPVQDITFRGNFTHSIRAPAITEAFNPTSSAFDSGNDPCDSRYIGQGPNPANRAANCAKAGVKQPFDSNYSDFTIPVTIAGNGNLRNEQADSYTFGAVVRPRYIKNLTISADYIDIALRDSIVSLGGNDILNACYDATNYPSSFCSLVTRDNTGQITFIKEGYYNAATQRLRAVTVEGAYAFDLSRVGLGANAGAINLSVNYYHVVDQYQQIGTGDVNHSVGEIGNPRNSFTANLNYASPHGLSFLWQTRYLGPSVINADGSPGDYQYPGVGDYFLFNTSIGYSLDKRFDLRLVIDNVFDRSPPFPAPAAGGATATTTYYSGLLGRYFRVSVARKF